MRLAVLFSALVLFGGCTCSKKNNNPAVVVVDAAPPPPLVAEKPAPECHDVKLTSKMVTPSGNPGVMPPGTPATTIPPGSYVVKDIVDYGGVAAESPVPSRTNAVFVGDKEYYVFEDSRGVQRVTAEWKIDNAFLTRKILCSSVPAHRVGQSTLARIESSPNGFLVYVKTPTRRDEAIYYEKAP